MKKFDVEITETLQRKVSVEAASQEDAERMVTQAWNNQDYVLDSGDFTGVDFKTVGEHELAETRTMDVLLVQPNAYQKKSWKICRPWSAAILKSPIHLRMKWPLF